MPFSNTASIQTREPLVYPTWERKSDRATSTPKDAISAAVDHRPLQRVVHHHHFFTRSQTESASGSESATQSLCSNCNLNIQTEINRKIPKLVFSFNGAAYDHSYCIMACVLYGKTLFPVINEQTGETIDYRPLVRPTPRVILKDGEQILSIEMKFNCLKSSCPPCSARRERLKRKKTGIAHPLRSQKDTPSCVFSRKIVFLDACQFMQSSLDKCVKDLARVSEDTSTPLEKIFKHTYEFAERMGLSKSESNKFVR